MERELEFKLYELFRQSQVLSEAKNNSVVVGNLDYKDSWLFDRIIKLIENERKQCVVSH